MSGPTRVRSPPSSSRPGDTRVAKMNCQVPEESSKTEPLSVNNQIIPEELLVSLTSTICNRSTLGQTEHHQCCKGYGIRRPDAVWHHALGRKKYKYFLEQPTSLTGAGRDISFLCDAMVTQRKTAPLPPLTDRSSNSDIQNLGISESLIPEEYHIVKNKGLRSLEFYEDAFTVQLQDDEQKLRAFPSLRPSGRLEVVQLMRMMDDMLEKAGVDQQSEELTELSQIEDLLELVQVEQNIYNIVFHELIRQVSVGCAERGQLLAKLRQRYQSMLERIPRRLKALHTEAVAQRALDRRLTEEIHRIKTSIQELSAELSKTREHDAFVSQQVEHAHRQLAEALDQTHSNSDVVQGYHELYELQRGRLEAQLLQMIKERNCWSQLTFCLALKVISIKKLEMVSRLHVCEQSWFKTAEHCILFLTSKDTEDLNIIMELSDTWKEQMTAFMIHLKKTEHAQCEQISAIRHGITKWLTFYTTQNKCPDPKYEKASLEKMHADLKQWSNTLTLMCERYQGEKLLDCQQTLGVIGSVQDRWLNMSLQLFRRHSSPDGEPPGGQQDLRELDRVLSELFKQLDMQVSGETGIHKWIMSLHSFMESWVTKLDEMIGHPEMSIPDCVKLEKALHNWQSLAEDAYNISRMQTEDTKDKSKPDVYKETENVIEKVQGFVSNLSNFTNGENQRLSEEVSSIHMGQTRWMLDLLILMVPDHSEDQNQEQEQHCITNISFQTLDEDAGILAEKLDCFSKYITSFYKLTVEEQMLQNLHRTEGENEMNECRKLEMECTDWVETCIILLSEVKGGPGELRVRQHATDSRSNIPLSPADSTLLFAQDSLRTLCIAVRSVPEASWEQWSKILAQSVAMVTSDREALLEKLYDEMERELQLLGVTAIEDRLQEGVPETIALLQQAGIKVWVLTGDKKETAVNIGYSCKLLDPDTTLLEWQELREILQSPNPGVSFFKARQTEVWAVDNKTAGAKAAVVLTGPELAEFDQRPEWGTTFMSVAEQCQSVLCCRVTPGQKADIVTLVRKHTSSVTMAIGDGANDVNMIKTAHVGVGLAGVEGGQAVQNADFAFCQFRFLQRLLLLHGRWSYQRISTFLRYFLFKTCGFALVHVWFGFFNGFSAQSLYETWFIALYTIFYTAYPVMCVAIFEQDVSAGSSLKWPELYKSGQRQELLSTLMLCLALLYAVYSSLVLFFIPVGVFYNTTLDYQTMAFTVSMAATFTAIIEIVMVTKYWTKHNIAAVCVSVVLFFISTRITHSTYLFQRSPIDYFFIGVSDQAYVNPVVWLTALLTAWVAVLPSFTARAFTVIVTNHDKNKIHNVSHQPVELRSQFRRGTSRRRSSYAVSQGAGPGHLITSGTCIRSTVPSVDEKVTASNNPIDLHSRTHMKGSNNGT